MVKTAGGEDGQFLYHGSPVQGLSQLVPRMGTHGQRWVYAAQDRAVAAVFLGRTGGDLTCAVGLVDGCLHLRERFPGAFDLRYGTAGGSLYVLPRDGFVPNQTSWCADWVCEQAVVPSQELQIDDIQGHLLGLVTEDRLRLLRYPEGVADVEAEEQDLVQTAGRKHRHQGEEILALVRDHHPHLLDRVLEAICREEAKECPKGTPSL